MEVTVQLILDGVTAVAESAVGLREPIFVRIVSHVCRRSGQSSVRIRRRRRRGDRKSRKSRKSTVAASEAQRGPNGRKKN